jgi:hypothetical protein
MFNFVVCRLRGCRFSAAAFGMALTVLAGAWLPATAGASRSQIAIIQDVHDAGAITDPQQTLAQFRELGASTVRVIIPERYEIYNDEYGYTTHPPARRHYVSPATAAYYDNWAEYLSWKNPQVASYMQYLQDPAPTSYFSGFDNGLETNSGEPKATYNAYRLPLYLPRTSFSNSTNAEVWGDMRPAAFMTRDGNGPQSVSIQLNNNTISTITATGLGGYFDLRMKFPASGSVRLAYTYPSSDPFLPVGAAGLAVYSRSVMIRVH